MAVQVNVFKMVQSWRHLASRDFEEILMVLVFNGCIGGAQGVDTMSTSVRALVDGFLTLTVPGEQCNYEVVCLLT
jgi:hypothetical protein